MKKQVFKKFMGSFLALAMVLSLLPAMTLHASAVNTVCPFSNLGAIADNYYSVGNYFKVGSESENVDDSHSPSVSSRVAVTAYNGVTSGTMSAFYPNDSVAMGGPSTPYTIYIKANGTSCKTFTFTDMGLSSCPVPNTWTFKSFVITFYDAYGSQIGLPDSFSNTGAISQTSVSLLSSITSHGVWNVPGVAAIKIDYYMLSTGGPLNGPANLQFENITVNDISDTLSAPTVTTQAVSSITAKTATGNGNVTALGSPKPTAYGVCWNTTGTPTITDSKVTNGAKSQTGAFTAAITGLTANTTYHVRAYATNSVGTSYGSEETFTTAAADTGTVLNAGDLVILEFNGNGNDGFTFMPLVDLAAGTVINFTDYGWSGTAFQIYEDGNPPAGGGNMITYTAPSSVAAGTLIRQNDLNVGGSAFAVDAEFSAYNHNNLNHIYSISSTATGHDGILAFQGSISSPTFIWGYHTGQWGKGTYDDNYWSNLPSGLTNGTNAVYFADLGSGDLTVDDGYYSGATTAATAAEWRARVANSANWTTLATGTAPTLLYPSTYTVILPNTPPTVDAATLVTVEYTDTSASNTFTNTKRTITATDSDGSVTYYGIAGELGCSYTYDGVIYNGYQGGAYGTLYVKSSTGEYVYVPDNAKINAVSTDQSETFTVTATDNLGASGSATLTVSITGTNDAPTLTASGKNPTYTEDGTAVQLFNTITVKTIESGQNITELELTVSNVSDGADETLYVDSQFVALTSGNGTTSAGIGYSVSLNAGTSTITLTKAGGFDVGALIAYLSYRNTSQSPTIGDRVITLTSIKDSGGIANGGVDNTALSIVSTVTVAAVNDAPVNSVPVSIAVTEDVASALTNISFADVDAGSASVTVTLSVGSGTLTATSSGNVTVGGTATAMTLSGKIADINAFIAASKVTFTTALNATANVTLTVAINDGGNTGSGGEETDSDTVTLTVTAVNDAPTSISLDNVSIAEGTAANTKIGTLLTTDPDSGDTFTYTIQSVKDKNNNAVSLATFAISDSELRTNAALSYSTNNSYTVTIQTKDSNNLTYEKDFTITVTEINAAPTNIALSETSVEENKGANFEVATLTATDPNASDTTFTYSLVDGDGSTDNGSFNISGNKLRLTGSADFETKPSYSVRIEVTDAGGLKKEIPFTINIINVNEAPVLTTLGGAAAFTEAATGTSTPVVVDGGLTVTDVDSGMHLTAVTATITSNYNSAQDVLSFANDGSSMGDIEASFTIATGVLALTSPSGTATVSQWQAALRAVKYTNTSHNPTVLTRTVTFSVSDGELTATATKNVSITQTNTAPTGIALTASTVDENSTVGTEVGTLTATDSDEDDAYTCSLVAGYGDNASFTIESVSATEYALKLDVSPNYEAKPSYSIRVRASDLAGATYDKVFTVNVANVNEAPSITSGATTSIAENATGMVYDANAIDPDGDTITFSISGTDVLLFNIDSGTGALTFKTAPNFESPTDNGANNVYDLTITATDNGTGSLAKTKAVDIIVTNVNEAPTITTEASKSVTEGSTAAFTAAATDPEGNSLTWSITGGDDSAKFSIVANTGVVTFATAPSFGTPTDFGANNTYEVIIQVSDGLNTATKTVTVTVTMQVFGGGSTTNTAVVEVNGKKQDAGTAETTTSGGQTTTTIKVDDTKLDKLLESNGDKPTVTLPSTAGSDVTVGELNGQTVKNMEKKEAVLEIKTESVSYTLPATEINIDNVSKQIGEAVELKDIKVSVKIAEPSADTVKVVENTANKGNYQLVVKPVEFEISCTYGNKTVDVSRFNGYVERTVAIPDGVDPSKITTGIVLNSDGSFSHVPTSIVVINGKYYAKINSLTNSTYSVIYNPVTFTDAANHWAKAAINDMGSRMVVTGVTSGIYEPDRSITRAEFAAIVVRALGLQKGTTESAFGDVTLTDWFNGYVDTATAYRLITGYDSASYGPNDTITREQAMTIVARALSLTDLKVSVSDSEASALLAKYSDGASVSSYAKNAAAVCLKTGVVTGTSATAISPKDYVTRAEVAVMVQRMLQKAGLI